MSVLDVMDRTIATGVLDWESLCSEYDWAGMMVGSSQSAHHHAEGDVATHTAMVVGELIAGEEWSAADARSRRILFAAALLHDIAKPATREVADDGSVSNHGHSRMGAKMARDVLWSEAWDQGEREMVCQLIAAHQVPFWLIEQTEAAQRIFLIKTSIIASNRLLYALALADAKGRRTVPESLRETTIDAVGLYRLAAEEEGVLDTPFAFDNDHARLRYLRSLPVEGQTRAPFASLYDVTDENFVMTILCGVPGAGKSYWRNAATARGGSHEAQPVVSLDDLRVAMRVAHDDNQGRVRQEATAQARRLLAARQSFIWDAVNIDSKRRMPLVELALAYGARVHMVAIERDLADVDAANRARAGVIPKERLAEMVRRWEPPTLLEAHTVELNHVEKPANRPGRRP